MTTTKTRAPAASASTAISGYLARSIKAAKTGPLAPPRTFDLMELAHLGEVVYDLMCDQIVRLRAAGATWQEIADGLDVSRQAAYERFKHIDPTKPDSSGRRNTGSRRTS